jgi:DNA-binding ferritin-like protein
VQKIAAYLAALIDRYTKVASSARAAIDATQEAGDADTADLFLLPRTRQVAVVPGSASSVA